MTLLTLLFTAIIVLLLYSLASDKGKNTKHFRNRRDTSEQTIHMRKKPLRTGESLY